MGYIIILDPHCELGTSTRWQQSSDQNYSREISCFQINENSTNNTAWNFKLWADRPCYYSEGRLLFQRYITACVNSPPISRNLESHHWGYLHRSMTRDLIYLITFLKHCSHSLNSNNAAFTHSETKLYLIATTDSNSHILKN